MSSEADAARRAVAPDMGGRGRDPVRACRGRAAMLSMLLLLCGCGGPTIDATNADAFERTFGQMIAEMPEKDREELADAILAVHAVARQERILPDALPNGRSVDRLLGLRLRPELAREIVRSAGGAVHGRTAAELLAMRKEVAAKADRNHAVWTREQRGKQRVMIRDQLSELEDRLAAMRRDVEAAEREKARARGEFQGDFAVLDRLGVTLDGQQAELQGGHVRSKLDLTFTNDTDHVVHDAAYGFDWVYGECRGYRRTMLGSRMFKTPLKPKASAAAVGEGGLGWTGESIPDGSGSRRCALAAETEYRITETRTAIAKVGDPPRTIDRGHLERELGRLDAEIGKSRERVSYVLKRIEDKTAALEALRADGFD